MVWWWKQESGHFLLSMLMCADQRRDSDDTREEMKRCGRQLLQAQQGGVGPAGQQVGFSGSVTKVTAVLPFFFQFFFNVACLPPNLPPSLIASFPSQAEQTQGSVWDEASRCFLLDPCSSFCNTVPPIKTGNASVCHQGASPEASVAEIRKSTQRLEM